MHNHKNLKTDWLGYELCSRLLADVAVG